MTLERYTWNFDFRVWLAAAMFLLAAYAAWQGWTAYQLALEAQRVAKLEGLARVVLVNPDGVFWRTVTMFFTSGMVFPLILLHARRMQLLNRAGDGRC